MMKLYDLLKITDELTHIIVWEEGWNEDDGPTYEGSVYNVPYTLADMYLYKGLDENTCAISVRASESGSPIMVVSVKEEKEV